MSPAFLRFWWGETVSGLGTWVTLLALQAIVVVTLHGGPTETGLLSAARWLPYLLVGLVVGALVDRVRRRPVMVATDLARAVVLAAIPVAAAYDVLTLGLLLVIVLVFATLTLVNDAASQSFVPRIVSAADLQRAHARLDGSDAVAQTAGPALGGLLVKLVGAPLAVLVDAVSFVFSALVVLTLRVEEPPRVTRRARALRREVVEGVQWVYRGSGLRDLALWTHVWFVAQGVLGALVAPYVMTTLGYSTLTFGLVTAAAGVGAVGGALLSTPIGRRLGSGGAVVLAHAVSSLGVVMMMAASVGGVAGGAALLAIGQLLHGFAMGSSNSHEMSYRQSRTPDALQARTNTTMRSLNRGVVVVAAPVAGVLADQVGIRPVLAVAAVLFGLTALGLWRSPFGRAPMAT